MTRPVWILALMGVVGLLFGASVAQASTASVFTGGVIETQSHSARVEGSIGPEGMPVTRCFFEYGTGQKASCEQDEAEIGTENTVTVTAPLTGLEPEETYHYKLVIESGGSLLSAENEGELRTLPRATATTETTSPITATGATLNGTVRVNTGSARYYFQYRKGEAGAFTKTLEEPASPLGEGETQVHAIVSGLEANTKYQVQLVVIAEGVAAAIEGNAEAFTTEKTGPVVVDSSVVGTPTRTTASIAGEIDPENDETSYTIEYEAPGGLAQSTLPVQVGAQGTGVKVAQVLSELKADTTYHYRIVASSDAGTVKGGEGTFTTAAAQPPSVTAESAQATSQTAATIAATVNSNGLAGGYVVEVGTEVDEGRPVYSTRSFGQLAESSEPQTLTLALTNLLPGTIYHYRIVAVNEEGTVPGADMTFTTPGQAGSIAQPTQPLIVAFTSSVETPVSAAKPAITKHATKKKAHKRKSKRRKKKGKSGAGAGKGHGKGGKG